MERAVNYFARRILRRRRMVTFRTQFLKIFDLYDTCLWTLTSLVGFEFFDTLVSIKRFGVHSVYNYFMAAFLFVIPIWCYLELTSLICSSGGIYHYSYSLINEIVGFIVGWLQILCSVTFISYTSALGGTLLDHIVFGNVFLESVKKFMHVAWNVNANFYLNRTPHFLGFFVANLLAAMCCPIKIVKLSLVIFFYVIAGFWMCFMMLITAYLNSDYFVTPNSNSVATFFSSYYDVSYMYPTIFSMVYLGGDVIDAEKNIPLAMIIAFAVVWVFYSVVALLMTFTWDFQDLDPFLVLTDIAFKTGGHKFREMIDFVALGCICSALCVYITTVVRVALSMARDGLLFTVFSRVERWTYYTAKPSLLIGAISGFVAIFVRRAFLERISKISQLYLSMFPPICILFLRYTDAFHTVLRVKQESAVLNEPFEHIGILIWVMVVCVIIMGYSTSLWAANFFINPFYGISHNEYRVAVTGVILVLATILLLFQKQNHYKSPYKVPLVPFVPIISLFTQSFMLPVIPNQYTITILSWLGLGVVFYFSYAMHFSRLSLMK